MESNSNSNILDQLQIRHKVFHKDIVPQKPTRRNSYDFFKSITENYSCNKRFTLFHLPFSCYGSKHVVTFVERKRNR